jgi:hypothetical protein
MVLSSQTMSRMRQGCLYPWHLPAFGFTHDLKGSFGDPNQAPGHVGVSRQNPPGRIHGKLSIQGSHSLVDKFSTFSLAAKA